MEYDVFYGHIYVWIDFFEEISADGTEIYSVRGQRYHGMLRDFLITQLLEHGCFEDIILELDGVPPLIDHLIKQFLR